MLAAVVHRSIALDAQDEATRGLGIADTQIDAVAGATYLRHDIEPAVGSNPEIELDSLSIEAGVIRLIRDGTVVLEEPAPCALDVMLSSPQAYLRSLLSQG